MSSSHENNVRQQSHETIRMTRLKSAFQMALDRSISSISNKSIRKCFDSNVAQNVDDIEVDCQHVALRIRDLVENAFDCISKEENLNVRFLLLQAMIDRQQQHQDQLQFSPENIVQQEKIKIKLHELERMQLLLNEVRSNVMTLSAEVERKRKVEAGYLKELKMNTSS